MNEVSSEESIDEKFEKTNGYVDLGEIDKRDKTSKRVNQTALEKCCILAISFELICLGIDLLAMVAVSVVAITGYALELFSVAMAISALNIMGIIAIALIVLIFLGAVIHSLAKRFLPKDGKKM
jgi:hypothetical protein